MRTRSDLASAPDDGAYARRPSAYTVSRDVTVGFLATSALAVVAGVVLRQRGRTPAVQLGAASQHGITLITLAWTR